MTATLIHPRPRRRAFRPSVLVRPFSLTVDQTTPRIVLSRRGLERPDEDADPGEVQSRRLLAYEGDTALRLMDDALEALHGSGSPVNGFGVEAPARLRLTEPDGARLALALWALAPVRKPSRLSLIRAGVNAMPDEEVYYWYAKAAGGTEAWSFHRRNRALKALRVLLAGE